MRRHFERLRSDDSISENGLERSKDGRPDAGADGDHAGAQRKEAGPAKRPSTPLGLLARVFSVSESESSVDSMLGDLSEVELLGSAEDVEALRDELKRFRRDDLAGHGDSLVCAVRMQVHMQTTWQLFIRTFLSCGLWVLFKPREDQGVLLLTRKGRIIKYGKGQEANPLVVWKYLEKVMVLFLAVTAALVCLQILLMEYIDLHMRTRAMLAAASLGFLALFFSYLYAQRPRQDCGTAFRQHFDVDRLNFATYLRADQGRHMRNFCMRRRQGHLRMSFGRFYPEMADFNGGLPAGGPDVGGLRPVETLPHATAGESATVQRNKVEIQKDSGGFGVRLSAFLAFMGLVGFYYDISTFVLSSAWDQTICRRKRRGCRWAVSNPPWLGMQRTLLGVNQPQVPETLCHGPPEEDDPFTWTFCEWYFHRYDHCMEEPEGSVPKFDVPCADMPKLKGYVSRQTTFDTRGRLLVKFIAATDFTLRSAPMPGFPYGRPASIKKGMMLTSLGGKDSRWTKQLLAMQPLHLADGSFMKRCKGPVYNGAITVEFKYMPDTELIDEEDCAELQEACKAGSLGLKTNGWFPPNRLLDGDYDRTFCWYDSYRSPWDSRMWNVVDEHDSGLTCIGEPLAHVPVTHVWGSGHEQYALDCKAACEKTPGCNYAFSGDEVNPLEFHMMNLSKRTPEYIRVSAGQQHVCWLYESCPWGGAVPFGKMQRQEQGQLFPYKCGETCDDRLLQCALLQESWRWSRVVKAGEGCFECSPHMCRHACITATAHVIWCNGYAYNEEPVMENGLPATLFTCIIYGPRHFRPAKQMHKWTPADSVGRVGLVAWAGLPRSQCYLRLLPRPPKRERAGRRGILMHWSDRPSCGGCFTRSITDFFFKTPSNVASVLTNLVTMLGFLYIARSAQVTFQAGRVVFTGKPMVDMTIVEDAANSQHFEKRERAYMQFMQRCFELANAERDRADAHDALAGLGEVRSTDCEVREVRRQSLDEYELSDVKRTACFIDRSMLGLFPGEKIVHAWSDTTRHAWQWMVLSALYQFAGVLLVCYLQPSDIGSVLLFWPLTLAVVLRALYNYSEYRREEQGVCVLTDRRRVVQMSRRPPAWWFLPWRGGVSVRLDVCHLGAIHLAQLDMPAVPLWKDRLRAAGLRPPWRRGIVAVRCEHGFVELSRKHGEAMDVFKAVLALAGSAARADLQSVGKGGVEVEGFSPARDLMLPGERHVWERRMDAFGFFGDAFNYVSVLSVTDRRVIVTRVRAPKPLTLVGMIIGPLTFGGYCRALQEHRGTHAYLTITAISHSHVESYATARTRSPPFWPGFMPPRTSISFTFLARFMHTYPAGLFITQRPYGMRLRARLRKEVRVAKRGKSLVVVSSQDKHAARGHVVVQIKDEEQRKLRTRDLVFDADDTAVVPAGYRLKFEPADPEWNTYSDEPWLRQLRQVLDQVLGRATAPEEAWMELDEPEPPPEPGRLERFVASIVGSECLGHRFRHRGTWRSDDEEEDEEDDDDDFSDGEDEDEDDEEESTTEHRRFLSRPLPRRGRSSAAE